MAWQGGGKEKKSDPFGRNWTRPINMWSIDKDAASEKAP